MLLALGISNVVCAELGGSMNPNLDELEKLAQAASLGNRRFETIPLPRFEDGKQNAVVLNIINDNGLRCGIILRHQAKNWEPSKEDQAFIAACNPTTILELVARIRGLEKLEQIVQREVSYYDDTWLKEHARDDHLVSLDHKDEISLSESIMAIKTGLSAYSEPRDD